jgi:uncharacterized protein YbbK (DUF523 family)
VKSGMPGVFGRPRIVVSECLELAEVRYNGERIASPFVRQLSDHVDLVPVCPEVGIGLGVPRDPIRLERQGDDVRLRQPSTGRDLTDAMDGFGDGFLARLGSVDGFVLKSRSPSCGIGDVKLHGGSDDDKVVTVMSGRFADAVLRRFPDVAAEDEVGLADSYRRHHWLTRVFTRATLREAVDSDGAGALRSFHAAYRLLLMAHDEAVAAELERLIGHVDGASPEAARAYARGVGRALRRSPAPPRWRRMLESWAREFGEDAPEVRRCQQPYPAALTVTVGRS